MYAGSEHYNIKTKFQFIYTFDSISKHFASVKIIFSYFRFITFKLVINMYNVGSFKNKHDHHLCFSQRIDANKN